MANPFKIIKDAALGTTIGKITTVSTVMVVSGVTYKLYQDERTGDIVGAEVMKRDVAVNDAQGKVNFKIEGQKDTPKDTKAAEKAAKEAAKAAEEAAKEAAKAKEA